jgi:hypothetical protein
MYVYGRRWDKPYEFEKMFMLGRTLSRSRIRFIREGLEGRITGYEEVPLPLPRIPRTYLESKRLEKAFGDYI